MNQHKILSRKTWVDPEPDTLSVSLETSSSDGEPHIVFSGNATWLTLKQAHGVKDYISELISLGYYIDSKKEQ